MANAREHQKKHAIATVHLPDDQLADTPGWDETRRAQHAVTMEIRELEDGTLRYGGTAGTVAYPAGYIPQTWGDLVAIGRADQPGLAAVPYGVERKPLFAEIPLSIQLESGEWEFLENRIAQAGEQAAAIMQDLPLPLADGQPANGEPVLRGIDKRVKEIDSVARKFLAEAKAGETLDTFVDGLNDLVRFTVELPGGAAYVPQLQAQLARLRAADYEIGEVKNFWHPGNRFYGLNATLVSPQGQRFELQFSTQDAIAAAKLTHEPYRAFRDVRKTMIDRIDGLLEIAAINKRYGMVEQIPPGAEALVLPGVAGPVLPTDTSMRAWQQKRPRDWGRYVKEVGTLTEAATLSRYLASVRVSAAKSGAQTAISRAEAALAHAAQVVSAPGVGGLREQAKMHGLTLREVFTGKAT